MPMLPVNHLFLFLLATDKTNQKSLVLNAQVPIFAIIVRLMVIALNAAGGFMAIPLHTSPTPGEDLLVLLTLLKGMVKI